MGKGLAVRLMKFVKGSKQKAFQDRYGCWFCLVVEDDLAGLIGFANGQQYSHAEHSEFLGEIVKFLLISDRRLSRSNCIRQRLKKTAYNAERYSDLYGYVQDVIDICDELVLKQVVFVGYSVSSMVGVLASILVTRFWTYPRVLN